MIAVASCWFDRRFQRCFLTTLAGMDPADDPPEEAYGRVTNPERFRVLHDTAHRFLDELAGQYEVTEIRGMTSDPSGSRDQAPFRELDPARPGVGRLRITFTAFPGLMVKLGQEQETALPACGCDACNDDPADLIEELHDQIDQLTDARAQKRTTRWRLKAPLPPANSTT
ncbi:hypothetical protein FB565_004685 [Actinoplanes lutulentus]|uniref:Uncharacterized protein n=1 Tax=Actinoplanes lutulentus TaxID=1287878 RepID=A0A327Z862_9ACTN|nr:DUF6226 family protein [Actinoplanes lutulentus]MBB2944952.1 hypothetical protein [Actinoplanes lutulentus]RAK35260.1 hypothetical protein B0I29_11012 [Actinoplanes lutulentus]